MMFTSCTSRCSLMQLEANTLHLLDIVSIPNKELANIHPTFHFRISFHNVRPSYHQISLTITHLIQSSYLLFVRKSRSLRMEILKIAECYTTADDNSLRFLHTAVLFHENGKTFSAQSSQRKLLTGVNLNLDTLDNVKELPLEEYSPLIPSDATIASPLDDDDVFIKKPNLLPYSDLKAISSNTLLEIEACEVLRMNPHGNVAFYGCNVDGQRVIGLCFKRYGITLMDKMNLRSLNKSMFIEEAQRDGAQVHIEGIRRGIEHLHSLGFVHNDITPSNIMIDEEDKPVIIDFHSFRREETDLQSVKRTYGWHDPKVKVSTKSSDLGALAEIRV